MLVRRRHLKRIEHSGLRSSRPRTHLSKAIPPWTQVVGALSGDRVLLEGASATVVQGRVGRTQFHSKSCTIVVLALEGVRAWRRLVRPATNAPGAAMAD